MNPLDHKRILYVAYPLLTVYEASAGGAEQVLWTLEHEMAKHGVQTTVAASAGSSVSGELFTTGEPCLQPDDFERRNREHQEKILHFVRQRALEDRPFDLVHDHSGSFSPQAAELDVPVLATLHLPRHFYRPESFENLPPNVSLNCVSQSQARSFADLKQMIGVAENGIVLGRFNSHAEKRSGLLWLGRICEEKAPHLALDIAEHAGIPITLAGQVYPFSYHQQYFEREIASRLQRFPIATFVQSPSAEKKQKLLSGAAALLITSQVDETSSLVAMEAASSGTPVVAFRRGALPEVVCDGVTGFLVSSLEEAVDALRKVPEIQSSACSRHAAEHFSSSAMACRYESLYRKVLRQPSAIAA
ncbi:MAG TPA: glycosyltransferase [Terriglobales bacterium]|nr:glycosyltransferase [Terriglobales bacterium]